jgi:hypothetical protein
MSEFTRFIAVDWSGARTGYAGKLQVALCEAGQAVPRLLTQGKETRTQVLALVQQQLAVPGTLVGFDFSFAPPFIDASAYLPGAQTPKTAKAFWAYVDHLCAAAPDLWAGPVIETHRSHFYLGKADGPKAPYMRLRHCEIAFNAAGGGKPSSVFDAIGAAQVSKASFAGMRLLHQLQHAAPVWPFDARPASGSLVVEIYCRLFIQAAGLRGLKLRDAPTLNQALVALGSQPYAAHSSLSDDQTDALVAAAGLRALSARAGLWSPKGLTPQIAQTEGWTFGVA